MNKQENEIKAEIVVLERYAKETKDRLESLHQRLAEAEKLEKLDKLLEKPKPRHGDFGYDKSGAPRVAMKDWTNKLSSVGEASYAKNAGYGTEPDALPQDPILGNVFDLMKDWDKPFEKWESKPAYKDAIQIIIEVVECGIFFGNSGNGATFELEDITKIYSKLGHAIAELKQKKEISGEKKRKL